MLLLIFGFVPACHVDYAPSAVIVYGSCPMSRLLHGEVTALRATHARLPQVAEPKDTEIAVLRTAHQAQLDALRAQVAALAAEVADLRARLGATSRNSPAPPSPDGPGKPAPVRRRDGHPGRWSCRDMDRPDEGRGKPSLGISPHRGRRERPRPQMRKEPVDQLTVRPATLDTVTIAGQDNMPPHSPPPGAWPESGRRNPPSRGSPTIRACRRAEGRLTGTRLSHEHPVGVKCRVTRGFFASQARTSACLRGVADHVQLGAWVGGGGLLQELQELLVAVPGVTGVGDLAGGGVEGGEQAGDAVPGVVVGLPLGDAASHRQDRLAALEGLALGLFVDADHNRIGRED